jgi:hypothetical protein
MAVVFEQKLTGMLVSIMVLGTLVNLAFLGFYYPQLVGRVGAAQLGQRLRQLGQKTACCLNFDANIDLLSSSIS